MPLILNTPPLPQHLSDLDLERLKFDWVRKLHVVRLLLTLAGLAICLFALGGHALQQEPLYRPIPDLPGMHPLAALSGLATGLALLGFRPLRRWRAAGGQLLSAALAVALFRLAEILILPGQAVSDGSVAVLGSAPGAPGLSMGINTAITAALLAAGLLMARGHPRAGLSLTAGALFLPLFSLLGYLYGVPKMHGAMSPLTTTAYSLLILAAVTTFAHKRILRVLLRGDVVGRLARWQIFVANGFFVVGGLLLVRIGGFVNLGQAVMFASICVWFVTCMVVVSAQSYERADTARRRRERQLAAQSLTDPLTGLANRRAAESAGAAMVARACRQDRPLAALMFDLDDFKHFNDSYGHATGDRILARVAHVLDTRLRRHDLVARWGGEEFVVFLADATEAEAETVAEEIRRRIGALSVEGPDGAPLRVSVSAGVAGRVRADGGCLAPLVARADAALYRAKQAGRDRVQRASEPPVLVMVAAPAPARLVPEPQSP